MSNLGKINKNGPVSGDRKTGGGIPFSLGTLTATTPGMPYQTGGWGWKQLPKISDKRAGEEVPPILAHRTEKHQPAIRGKTGRSEFPQKRKEQTLPNPKKRNSCLGKWDKFGCSWAQEKIKTRRAKNRVALRWESKESGTPKHSPPFKRKVSRAKTELGPPTGKRVSTNSD